MILLDSDVVVDLLRGLPQARQWFPDQANERFVLPGYVAMELVQGCRSKAELTILENHIARMLVVWPTPETCDRALSTYARSRFSHSLGILDALVGELAKSLDAPLHTLNQKHYVAVLGLRTEQPYTR